MTSVEIGEVLERWGALEPLPAEILHRFETYLSLLLKWNARLNLTAIRDPKIIIERHFAECIFLAQHLPTGVCTVLDFGSGGGFPGLPIAICRPDLRVTMAESQTKKAAFLREAVRSLAMDTTVFHGRVEDFDPTFDVVTLRAVDKMLEALPVAASKVGPEGWLILFSTSSTFETFQASLPGFRWNLPINVPGSSQEILLFGQR